MGLHQGSTSLKGQGKSGRHDDWAQCAHPLPERSLPNVANGSLEAAGAGAGAEKLFQSAAVAVDPAIGQQVRPFPGESSRPANLDFKWQTVS